MLLNLTVVNAIKLLFQFLKQRVYVPREEGRKEGRSEEKKEGRERGREGRKKLVRNFVARKLSAEY